VNESQFWALIADSRSEGRAGTEEQCEWLSAHLEQREPAEILEFERNFLRFFAKAYSWHLRNAAALLFGGCGDDSFMDFRAGLIAQGEEIYTRVFEQPDDLITLFEDAEQADLEAGAEAEETVLIGSSIQLVAQKTYESKTGLQMPLMFELPDEMTGENLDESELEARYPKLWAWDNA
jgi:Protein of unknown function (DUF4240)